MPGNDTASDEQRRAIARHLIESLSERGVGVCTTGVLGTGVPPVLPRRTLNKQEYGRDGRNTGEGGTSNKVEKTVPQHGRDGHATGCTVVAPLPQQVANRF